MFECTICHKEFSRNCGLKFHLNHTHGDKRNKFSKEECIKRSSRLKGNPKCTGIARTPEAEKLRKEKISATMKKNPNAGGFRIGSGRSNKCWYESEIAGKVYCHSSYELKYARWLDSNGINWKKNWDKFPYIFKDKSHSYIPDFYIVDENKFVEIKGYQQDRDLAKWAHFPHRLEILKREDLEKMNII